MVDWNQQINCVESVSSDLTLFFLPLSAIDIFSQKYPLQISHVTFLVTLLFGNGKYARSRSKLERYFRRQNAPAGIYDQETKQACVVLRNLTTVRFSLCEAQSHRRHFAECPTLYACLFPEYVVTEPETFVRGSLNFLYLRSFVYAMQKVEYRRMFRLNVFSFR